MTWLLALVILASLLGIGCVFHNFKVVKALDEGTDTMKEIARAIRTGANAFIKYEYKVLTVVATVLTLTLGIFISIPSGIAFLLGIFLSGAAGWIGMKIATYANVRVANKARITLNIGDTLKVAFRGGSVMGICVSAFAILGLFILYIAFGYQLNSFDTVTNRFGIEFLPFGMTISSYALGCSVIALFNRVGGGIYTKAADMGADLVGKTELNIPEDDPRNPATIADNVGDNVGDVAGLGSDLLESYVGSIVSAIVLGIHLYVSSVAKNGGMDIAFVKSAYLYPLVFAALGLIACLIGIFFVLVKKPGDNPHFELNLSTWISAGLTIFLTLIITKVMFGNVPITDTNFALGSISPWLSAVMGIISGIVIGMLAEYYTSYDYNPTRQIALLSKEGPALNITKGMAVGMISCMLPVLVIGFALMLSYYFCGLYGVAMSAVGMLSFVSTTVSVDTYGPISDNAGGIAEMAELNPEVRKITDKLDSVGNTTAAIGKGFAIGSASFATLSLMVSFLFSFNPVGKELSLNLMNSTVLAGALIGAALPYFFSGMLINAVAKSARLMVDEVRRQFREIPGLLEGLNKPDYKTCIEISSKGALKQMIMPALLSIIFPVTAGFIFGAEFVGGILLGSTISAIMLAIYTGNAGGAWDNAKKYIESGGVSSEQKGTPAHIASVVGDTVGDPLKDTVGPSLDILIKIMSTISLIIGAIFNKYNLINSAISSVFKENFVFIIMGIATISLLIYCTKKFVVRKKNN